MRRGEHRARVYGCGTLCGMAGIAIPLITASAALAGSTVTGVFALIAAKRSAAAQKEQLRATHLEQENIRKDERRRQAYAALLSAIGQLRASRYAAGGIFNSPVTAILNQTEEQKMATRLARAAVIEAVGVIALVGPGEVALAAAELRNAALRDEGVPAARTAFIKAAQAALN